MPSENDPEMPTAGFQVAQAGGEAITIEYVAIEIGPHTFTGGTLYFPPRAEVQTLDEVREERGGV